MKKKGLILLLMLVFSLFLIGISGKNNVSAEDPQKWEIVNSINDLKVGDSIIIANAGSGFGLGGIHEKEYGIQEKITFSSDGKQITNKQNAQEYFLENGYSTGTYAFKNSEGKYLAWTSGNSLKVTDTLSNNSSWTIEINSGTSTIKNYKDSSRKLQYNSASTGLRFACYTTAQQSVSLYRADTTLKDLQSLLTTYYNEGNYTKDTIINVDLSAKTVEEMQKYFHANVIPALERRTVYTSYESTKETNKLVMTTTEDTSGVGYKDADGNMVRFHYDGTKEVADFPVNDTSVEEYYVTLNDFITGNTGDKCNYGYMDLTQGWTKSGDVYTSKDANVIEGFRLFTAPMWISTDKNYFDFTHVTISLGTDDLKNELVMTLWVAKGDSGKTLDDTLLDSTGQYLVFSQATIYYPYEKEEENLREELNSWFVANKSTTDSIELLEKDSKGLFDLKWIYNNEEVTRLTETGIYNLTVYYSAYNISGSLSGEVEIKTEVQLVEKTYSYTFTSKQWSSNAAKTLNGVSWTLAGSGNYWGYDSTKGQQFGSGNSPYKSFTLTSASFSNVSKIVINTSGASSIKGSLSVTVGGQQIGNEITLSETATEYTFEWDKQVSGAVVLSFKQTSSKAIYIKSIIVIYAE